MLRGRTPGPNGPGLARRIKVRYFSSSSTPGPSRHNRVMRRAAILPLIFTTIASAQALLSPSDAERERQQFAPRSGEMALKCEVTPVAPTVNLAFRTEAGYIFHVPRSQYARPTDGWTVFTAITPAHGKPAYLLAHNSPAQATNTGSNFEIPGAYFLGSGHYTVESTIRDGGNLVCRQHWKVDVAAHGDRGIPLALAPSAIEDYAHAGLPISGHPDHAPPMRVTILLDVATFSHRRTVIVDRDRERMTQSLTALVEHLPAAALSVTALSLEQEREIFHTSAFGAQDLVRLNTAIASAPQASVDVNLLKDPHGHVGYLTAFIRRVLETTGEGDTVIFLGPTSRYRDAVSKDALPPTESHPRFFYVRYESVPPLTSDVAETYINIPVDPRTANDAMPSLDPIGALNGTAPTYGNAPGDPIGVRDPTRSIDPSYGQPDIISKVVTLLNGRNFIVHSSAELAEAIRKIEGRR